MANCRYKFAAMACLILSAAVLRAQELSPAIVKGNVSVQLPKGWVEGAAGGKTVLVAGSAEKDKDATGEFPASLSITVTDGTKIDVAAEQKQLAAIPGYKADGQPVNIAVNGLQGVMLGGTLVNAGVALQSRQYIFIQNNQKFVITITTLKSRFPAYRAAIEASIGTFKVAK